MSAAAAERRALAAQFDAEGKTGGFRPLLDLGHRMDAVFERLAARAGRGG